jgi:hypothetical protein
MHGEVRSPYNILVGKNVKQRELFADWDILFKINITIELEEFKFELTDLGFLCR